MTAEDRAPTPTGRTQLSDLVRDRKDALDLGYERLARRCVDPVSGERTVNGSWLHRLATGQAVQPPDLPQLRGMAAGLELPLRVIQDAAAAQFFGLDSVYAPQGDARVMISDYEKLSEDDRARVRAIIDTFRRQ